MADVGRWADRRDFQVWLLEQHYATKTREAYISHVRRCHDVLAREGVSLRRAHPEHIRLYLTTLEPTAPSWNQARNALTAFYKFTGRRPHPVEDIDTIPEPEHLPRPLSAEGHVMFLSAAHALGGLHRIVGLLFATTGVRFAGLQKARWSEFELDGESPIWRIQGKGSARKGPKTYQVPIHSTVAPIVVAWRFSSRSPEWVLPGRTRAGHLSEKALRATFRDICETAGLEDITPHVLRHTVATAALEQCGDIEAVRNLLGHSNISSTQRYTKVLPSRLRSVVEQLPAGRTYMEPPDVEPLPPPDPESIMRPLRASRLMKKPARSPLPFRGLHTIAVVDVQESA